MNTQKGERYSIGTNGAVTGMHGHFIIVDDPVDPNRAVSETELKNSNRWMSETLSTRKVDKQVTPMILIMQRLHQDDPTGHILEKTNPDKIKHINLPAEMVDENSGSVSNNVEGVMKKVGVRPRSLKKFYKDGLMDPVRLSRDVLDENKATLGLKVYSGQFLQNPIPEGMETFAIEKIEVVSGVDMKIFANKNKMVRFWDKAGTNKGGAYTVGVLMGIDRDGFVWVLDIVRGQWNSARREAIIKSTAEKDTRAITVGVEQEPGSGGKESAENTARNLKGFRVRKIRPVGDKILRADPFSVEVNKGNVKIVRAEWNREYLNELQFFPDSKFKDQVDASSGAFSCLINNKKRAGAL